jgi:hypothetical protein
MPELRVAVCAPSDCVLRLYPIYAENGARFALVEGAFVPLEELPGFIREEPVPPKNPLLV